MNLDRILYNLNVPLSSRDYTLAVFIITALLFLLLYLLSPLYSLLALLIPIFAYIGLDYLHRRKIQRMEEELPRFVHLLSTYPIHSLRDVIKLGSKGFGELSSEFSGLQKLVERGSSPARVLRSFARRTGSPYILRVMDGIVTAFHSGVPDSFLRNLSEELYFMHEMEGERRSSLSLQRYSILLSSVFLVPFILGLVVSMVRHLGYSNPFILSLIIPYLIMLSFISGSFLAWTEGKPKNAPLYILLGSLTSVSVYVVVSWLY